jgi:hypothetical protein
MRDLPVKDDLLEHRAQGKLIRSTECRAESDDWYLISVANSSAWSAKPDLKTDGLTRIWATQSKEAGPGR